MTDIPENTPEPVPATNQAGEVEEQAPYTWRLDRSESESLFAALHGLTCSRDIHDIPDVMEAVTDIFRSTVGGDATRSRDLNEFAALAESINDSPALMSVYAAPEWDELDDNGRQWVSALVRETMARCRQDYAAALATQPATSQEGERDAIAQIIRSYCEDGVRAEPFGGSLDNADLAADRILALAATPTPPTLSDDLRALVGTGNFLLDRLVDHEVRMTSDDDAREWYGHVTPAMERFRAALAQVKAS